MIPEQIEWQRGFSDGVAQSQTRIAELERQLAEARTVMEAAYNDLEEAQGGDDEMVCYALNRLTDWLDGRAGKGGTPASEPNEKSPDHEGRGR